MSIATAQCSHQAIVQIVVRREIHIAAFAGDRLILSSTTDHQAYAKPGSGADDADHSAFGKSNVRPGNVQKARCTKRRNCMPEGGKIIEDYVLGDDQGPRDHSRVDRPGDVAELGQ